MNKLKMVMNSIYEKEYNQICLEMKLYAAVDC
jgi:hypothetical protein